MSVLLTSQGLCTDTIRKAFRNSLPASPGNCRVLFMITAANRPESLLQLPTTLQQLTDTGIYSDKIEICTLHEPIPTPYLLEYHLICICNGAPHYLRDRINQFRFGDALLDYIRAKRPVLAVGRSSLVFACNLSGNLGLLKFGLYVDEDEQAEPPGPIRMRRTMPIHLASDQALWVHDAEHAEII